MLYRQPEAERRRTTNEVSIHMDDTRNFVRLRGAAGDPQVSHENHGQRFFRFPLSVRRLSGQPDVIYVIATGEQLQPLLPLEGRRLTVEGQLRSFNNKSGQGSRLVISVFARVLTEAEENDDCNEIQLQGVLCKPPVLRRTPLGRCICDMMLAVNRRYGRAVYLPCIAWGQVAVLTGRLDTGSPLALEGRVQSRIYTKIVDGQPQERTAYEVSVMHLVDPDPAPEPGDSET